MGHLDVVTEMVPQKRLALSNPVHVSSGAPVTGYEIHIGRTAGADCGRAWLALDGRPEGAADASGRIKGCYLHGLFAGDAFRAAYLSEMGGQSALMNFEASVDETLDNPNHMARHLDLDGLLATASNVSAR